MEKLKLRMNEWEHEDRKAEQRLKKAQSENDDSQALINELKNTRVINFNLISSLNLN